MYTAQLTVERIQALIKEKNLTQKQVLSDCGINENTLKKMTDNKGMSSFNLAKIADILDCSVDYLLGRTDTPNIQNSNVISTGSIKGSHINGDTSVNIGTDFSKDIKEIVDLLGSLTLVQRAEIILKINEMKNN